MTSLNANDVTPWYRQFWPWVLIGLPASIVVSSFFMLWLAITSANDMVVDDYYKEGLAINQSLEEDQFAQELKLSASLYFGTTGVHLLLEPVPKETHSLQLNIIHPLNAKEDKQLTLVSTQPGYFQYQGEMPTLQDHWYLQLTGTTNNQRWKLRSASSVTLLADKEIVLRPQVDE